MIFTVLYGTSNAQAPTLDDSLLQGSTYLIVLSVDTQKTKDKTGWVYQWVYHLTGYLPGQYVISPVMIKDGANNYSTQGIPILIAESQGVGDPQGLVENFEAFVIPWYKSDTFWQGTRIVWAFLLIGMSLMMLFFFIKKKISRLFEAQKSPPFIPPPLSREELAKRLIGKLSQLAEKAKSVDTFPQATYLMGELSEEIHLFYSELTKNYLLSATPNEFCYRLKFIFEKEAVAMTECFSQWDRMRFARQESVRDLSSYLTHQINQAKKIILCGI